VQSPFRLLGPLHSGQEPLEYIGRREPSQRRSIHQQVLVPGRAGNRDSGADQGDCFIEREGADGSINRTIPLSCETNRLFQTFAFRKLVNTNQVSRIILAAKPACKARAD